MTCFLFYKNILPKMLGRIDTPGNDIPAKIVSEIYNNL